jgi:hypothetical protein
MKHWRITSKQLLVVKALLNLIQAEFIKFKRKYIILAALCAALIPPLINVIYTFNLPKDSTINNSFMTFFQSSFSFTEWILLPCVFGAFESFIYFMEKENRTLKELMVIPVNKIMFLLAKFIMLVLFAVLFMLLTTTCTVIGALPFHYSDMSMTLITKLFRISLETGILTSLSMQPILLIVIASQVSYILPICVTLIYSISGVTFASQLAGIHPLASVYGIVWSKSLKDFSIHTSFELFAFNIAVIFVLSFIASVFLLRKQNY